MSDATHPARSKSQGDGDRESIEKQLADKKASINERIDELEDEIVSTPAAVKAAVLNHPFLGIAGAIAAGLAVGLLVMRRRSPDTAPFHQRLVEHYIDAVGDDVRYRMRRGRSIEEAVHEALQGRAPFILYAPVRETERESKGFFKGFADIALKTALGFTVKTAIDLFSARLDVEELKQLLAVEEEMASPGAENASHTGDGAAGTVDSSTEAS